MTIEVRNDIDRSQYTLLDDGDVIGFAAYESDGDRIRFVHTEVDPQHRGNGQASHLVRYALDDVRTNSDMRVVPQCTYVAAWIRRHPEYEEFLDD